MSDDLFRMALGSYGPPWRFKDENSVEAQSVQQSLDFFRWAINSQRRAVGPAGIIHCDLIGNPAFNALATTYKNHEFVTLFSGAINSIYTTFFGMLSDPEFLPSICNALGESVSKKASELVRSGMFLPSHLPKDAQRLQAARDFSALTCLFILLHEVGHIVQGHSTFLQRKQGMPIYEEVPVFTLNAKESETRLAFEWEADEYAAIASYQVVHALFQDISLFPTLQSLDTDLIWSISASTTFVLIGYFSAGMTSSSPTHPPALYRYVWSMMSVEAALECKHFSPDSASFRAGFAEVANWFKRNRLDIISGGASAEYQAAYHLQGFDEQYKSIKQVLASEEDFLSQIAEQRYIGAEAWRARQPHA